MLFIAWAKCLHSAFVITNLWLKYDCVMWWCDCNALVVKIDIRFPNTISVPISIVRFGSLSFSSVRLWLFIFAQLSPSKDIFFFDFVFILWVVELSSFLLLLAATKFICKKTKNSKRNSCADLLRSSVSHTELVHRHLIAHQLSIYPISDPVASSHVYICIMHSIRISVMESHFRPRHLWQRKMFK